VKRIKRGCAKALPLISVPDDPKPEAVLLHSLHNAFKARTVVHFLIDFGIALMPEESGK
jgi:hypothetical protein